MQICACFPDRVSESDTLTHLTAAD